jgi:hypothetical protein
MKLILFACLLFFSCNKEKKPRCYKCTVESSGGFGNANPEQVCTDRIDTVEFKTIDGRSLTFNCEPL